MSDPAITCHAVYPTLAVPDVAAACQWYIDKLGFEMRFLWGEPATHGAIMLDQACVHFREGVADAGNVFLYFDISDVEAMHARAVAGGVTITRPPETFPWEMREFNALDLNGYEVRFGQHVGDTG